MEQNISNKIASIQKAKDEATDAETNLSRLQTEYQNMCAGISSDEGDEGRTLPDQISKAHSDANNAEAKAKQAQMKIDHLEKSLKVSVVFRMSTLGSYVFFCLLRFTHPHTFIVPAVHSLLRRI